MALHKNTHTDMEYEAENDLHILVQAAKIGKDKKRHDAAMKMARKQMKALKDIKKT